MASKVILKMPTVGNFGQVSKSKSGNINGDIVVATSRPHDLSSRSPSPPSLHNLEELQLLDDVVVVDPADEDSVTNGDTFNNGHDRSRIAQLEQNIKFLQEQHQLMLTGLHNEIVVLKNRNRDLQFQLVFAKVPTPVSSPSSSSEDDLKHKIYTSPKPANLTPLQIEILERELGELRLQLQETENRNAYLNSLVEEQKKEIERIDTERQKNDYEQQQQLVKSTGGATESGLGNVAAIEDDANNVELVRRLDEAETLIRKLRRENSDLRRENAVAAAAAAGRYKNGGGDGSNRGGGENCYGATSPRSSGGVNNGGGSSRGNNGRHKGNGHYRDDWFPPLNAQNYWQQQQGRRGAGHNRAKHSNHPIAAASSLQDDTHLMQHAHNVAATAEESIPNNTNTLPELNQPIAAASSTHPNHQPNHHRHHHGGRRGHNNNNHHYQEGGGGGGGGGAGGGRKYHHRPHHHNQHKNQQT